MRSAIFTLIIGFGCKASDSSTEMNETMEQAPFSEAGWAPSNYHPSDPVRVMYMGDSVSAGDGASNPSSKFTALLTENNDSIWPDHTELDLKSFYPNMSAVIDVAKGGARTNELVNDQLPRMAEAIGDSVEGESIAVMTIGGNDVNASVTQIWYALMMQDDKEAADEIVEDLIDKLHNNLELMLDFYEDSERFPDGVKVYVANVYDPTDGVGLSDICFPGLDLQEAISYLSAVNDSYIDLAKERNFGVIDLHGHFLGHAFHHNDPNSPHYKESDPSIWFDDCLHPNDTGHHELRKLFSSVITGEDHLN